MNPIPGKERWNETSYLRRHVGYGYATTEFDNRHDTYGAPTLFSSVLDRETGHVYRISKMTIGGGDPRDRAYRTQLRQDYLRRRSNLNRKLRSMDASNPDYQRILDRASNLKPPKELLTHDIDIMGLIREPSTGNASDYLELPFEEVRETFELV